MKEKKQRPRRPEEFKRAVVEYLEKNKKTMAQVALVFNVSPENVKAWKHQYTRTKSIDSPVPATPEAKTYEIEKLRLELARMTSQRELLKKTVSLLSEQLLNA